MGAFSIYKSYEKHKIYDLSWFFNASRQVWSRSLQRFWRRVSFLGLQNEVGRHIIFAPFLLLLRFLFLSAQILSGRVLSNYWTDCSETWVYNRYGYEVVQESFKIQNGRSKGFPWGMLKSAQIVSGRVHGNHMTDFCVACIAWQTHRDHVVRPRLRRPRRRRCRRHTFRFRSITLEGKYCIDFVQILQNFISL